MKLHFFGATRTVTGSHFMLEACGKKIVVDCGLYQGRGMKDRNWDPFAVDPKEVDIVLLTHGHLDHCGLLPKFVREGFTGTIYATSATAEIAKIVMLDSAHMHEEDAKYKAKRHKREKRKGPHPIVPLYTKNDAQAVLPLFEPVRYETEQRVADGVTATWHDAGHILGSSMIKVQVTEDGKTRSIIFSGDIGRNDKPILRDPSTFEEADYVVMESTYGDRTHPEEADIETMLAEAINKTVERGGNLLIPCFAVERSQELLYHLNQLQRDKRIPRIMTFLDSPMAVSVTRVFRDHKEMFDEEMTDLVKSGGSPFDMPGLKLVRTVETSKSINYIRGTSIIIAGSGMCTGGRIKHHLVQNIHRSESMILFVGYQAQGTLGRIISEGQKEEIRILGRFFPLRAHVNQIHGFSGHADKEEMKTWLGHLKTPPKRVFIIHGENSVSEKFAAWLGKETGWNVHAPEWLESVELE